MGPHRVINTYKRKAAIEFMVMCLAVNWLKGNEENKVRETKITNASECAVVIISITKNSQNSLQLAINTILLSKFTSTVIKLRC